MALWPGGQPRPLRGSPRDPDSPPARPPDGDRLRAAARPLGRLAERTLSLDPYRWIRNLNFALSGTLLAALAVGLDRGLKRGSKAGPAPLFVAGVAIALLALETDPINRTGPRTPHGAIHDAASMLFVLALLPARMRKDPVWRGHARYTVATALVSTVTLLARRRVLPIPRSDASPV